MCENKSCCCKCVSQIELRKHPWNEIGKGSIMETFGYACTVMMEMDNDNKAIFFDRQHSECEMFQLKKTDDSTLENKEIS